MIQTKKITPNTHRVRVKDITTDWIGRVNDVDGTLTEVEWLKDAEGNYTEITSWVPSENLVKL